MKFLTNTNKLTTKLIAKVTEIFCKHFFVLYFQIIVHFSYLIAALTFYSARFINEAKSQFIKMSVHKFGYIEQNLLTRLLEGTKEKQKSHNKLAHASIQKENNTNEINEEFGYY